MRILAIDTALGACAACVLASDAAAPEAQESLAMERGHAEALLPLIDRIIARVERRFAALDRVAVSVGPGSYTGLRVGLSAARAIGLAIGKPVVGVSTLSALLLPLVSAAQRGLAVALIDARHGQVYVQAIAPGGRIVIPPTLLPARDVVRLIGTGSVTLTGSGAPIVAAEAKGAGVDITVHDAPAAPQIVSVARLGLASDPAQAVPKPLYLRAPDAQPQDCERLLRS